MVTSTRAPAKAAPSPTSRATFSLGAHWARPPSAENASRISVDGVPGYPVPRATSPSSAAMATASSPLHSPRTGAFVAAVSTIDRLFREMGRRFSPFGVPAARAGGARPVVANPRPVDPVRTLDELVLRARALGPRVVAVPAAESDTALAAVVEARRRGIARGLLLGDREALATRLWRLEEDPSHHEIVHEPDDSRAAALAVERVRAGEADMLLKGRLPTGDLLRAVLDREHGLRTGRILSDVMVSEHPTASPRRVVGITDGGVNVAPGLAEKRAILENGVRVFHRLGFERPVVACLCAVETPTEAMPHTQDARELAELAR